MRAVLLGRRNGSDLGIPKTWLPQFDEYSVDLVVNGHDHDHERDDAARDPRDDPRRDPAAVSRAVHLAPALSPAA